MDELSTLLINYGALGVVAAYFIYKDYNVSRTMLDVLIFIKGYICSLKGDDVDE